mmetsp:Transcript_21127/g.43302  ORF Transcript_21127/g.43302 Transcript_21127/m.43302 type:complete len:240 (+) Transcript_21127:1479-2198(+)
MAPAAPLAPAGPPGGLMWCKPAGSTKTWPGTSKGSGACLTKSPPDVSCCPRTPKGTRSTHSMNSATFSLPTAANFLPPSGATDTAACTASSLASFSEAACSISSAAWSAGMARTSRPSLSTAQVALFASAASLAFFSLLGLLAAWVFTVRVSQDSMNERISPVPNHIVSASTVSMFPSTTKTLFISAASMVECAAITTSRSGRERTNSMSSAARCATDRRGSRTSPSPQNGSSSSSTKA